MMLCMLAPLPSFIKAFGRFNRLITSHDEYHAMNKKWHISTDLWGLVFLSLKLYRFSPYACQYRWTNRSLWPFSATSYSSFGPLSPSLSLCLYLCNFFSHRKENERIVAEKKKKKWISTEREKNMAKNNISLKWLSNRSDCEEITKAFNRLFIIVLFEHAPRQ